MTHFPLSRALLEAILADRLSDRFVCELVWWRLGYRPPQEDDARFPSLGSPPPGGQAPRRRPTGRKRFRRLPS